MDSTSRAFPNQCYESILLVPIDSHCIALSILFQEG